MGRGVLVCYQRQISHSLEPRHEALPHQGFDSVDTIVKVLGGLPVQRLLILSKEEQVLSKSLQQHLNTIEARIELNQSRCDGTAVVFLDLPPHIIEEVRGFRRDPEPIARYRPLPDMGPQTLQQDHELSETRLA